MKKVLILIPACIFTLLQISHAQKKETYIPQIEPCDCLVKVDSSFQTQCGYLIVPENRKKRNGKTIRLPFVWVKSKNPDKQKAPLLYTAGGPGGSSLGWARGSTQRSVISNRDCIAFEQRGTHHALPNLWSDELSNAIRESYQKNLNKDSMVLEGTKRYKKSLEAKGIDLAGYNTDETVSDIHDLLKTLAIDSVNLLGGSYSGGLMLAVLQKDPSRIRSLVLDSPLPTFVPIDEEEPNNFNEALSILFQYCDKDSTDKSRYGNLKEKFRDYFASIGNKIFSIPYVEKGKTDTVHIEYTRSELLGTIVNMLYDYSWIRDVPYLITEIIKGNHQPYIKDILDHIFNSGNGPSGMRISVYCADQTAYHDEAVLQQFYQAYPYLQGYHINDVYKEMCDFWKVPPINPTTKQPFYSDKPVLLAAGLLDPACRPLYIDMIHHYMANSQRLLFTQRSHMVLGGKEADAIIKSFLDNPFKKIEPGQKDIIVY
jgi:pimeloyl-ACP methyl ester carboxylesterase